jgi:phospho-N-acetylmuramoyl-pentapeptide-transferase
MLYWLSAFSDTIGPLNVLRYITFRTGGAMITALVFVLLFGPSIVAVLRRRQDRPICPTGLIVLSALLVATLLWARLDNPYVWIATGVTLGFGLIGFFGDYVEATGQSAFSDRVRIAIAASIAVAACLALMRLGSRPSATSLGFPFGKEFVVDLGWFYIVVGAFIIVAVGNMVNLADRLHKCVTGPLLIAALSFMLVAYLAGNFIFAEYLNIHYVPATGELAVLCGAVVGAGLGFLWSYAPPASSFIGDTGSLALGGVLSTVAVATKHEVVLALISSMFVLKPPPAKG